MVLLQAAFSFQEALDYLVELGVYEVFLPFLLVFAIIFAILEKTKILGEERSNINAVVARVIGLLLVVQKGIVEIINVFLPRISLIIVILLMGLLIIAMLAGREFQGLQGTTLGVAMVLVVIAVIIALNTSPLGNSWLSPADREALLRIGIPLLIFFGVIALVTGGPKKQGHKNIFKKIAEDLREAGR